MRRKHTREASIECSHPAFTCSLRTRSQNCTHNNIPNLIWVQIGLLYQRLQSHNLQNKIQLQQLQVSFFWQRKKRKTNLQNRCKNIISISILKPTAFRFANCSPMCSAKWFYFIIYSFWIQNFSPPVIKWFHKIANLPNPIKGRNLRNYNHIVPKNIRPMICSTVPSQTCRRLEVPNYNHKSINHLVF